MTKENANRLIHQIQERMQDVSPTEIEAAIREADDDSTQTVGTPVVVVEATLSLSDEAPELESALTLVA